MSESPREHDELPAPAAAAGRERARGWAEASGWVLGCAVGATGLLWLGRLLATAEPLGGAWAVQAGLTVAAVLAGGAAAAGYRWRSFKNVRTLSEQLPRVQRGEAPIEQLSEIGGGLGPLVPAVQDLLRELRQQRAATAELELEIRQRVANRTDALERTIGTLRHQATRDALTGLFNRRFLDQYLPQCVQRHLKSNGELCLLMMDVDNFKVLNDTLGHAAGDDLLRAIGQLIRSAARGEDVAFRCGGDEFVVLLPGYGTDAGRALADRLTSLVDCLGRTLKVPRKPRLAIGMTTLSACDDRTPDGLLAAADRSLYEVKRVRKAGAPSRGVA